MRNLLVAFLSFIAFSAVAQNDMATGKITNPRGEPVSFATITVKGTKTTVVADADGSFKIKAAPGKTLLVSAASYTSKEFYLSALTGNDLVLQPGQASLNEVVVVALGQSKSKARVGYATQTFNSEIINRASPVSMLDGLQGKVAGADISSVSGTPGGSTKVVLRGFGVIGGGNNQPLYVIDGVPLSDFSINTGGA
ncbi:MAG TPA: carboxypeptidase-like regulatory domain-containing protein, partial [Puia sp.]|nr:carboxypeptidase-like regulatory domain-containing protein [Puia sp.]